MTKVRDEAQTGGSPNGETDGLSEERAELLDRVSAWLDVPMSILGLLWTILVVLQLAAPLSEPWAGRIGRLDTFIWLVFASHFAFEFLIAPNKTRYLRTHWLTAVSVALPLLRVVRLARAVAVVRRLWLARVVLLGNRASRAAATIFDRHRIGYVLAVVAVLTALGAAAEVYFERGAPGATLADYPSALYWAASLVVDASVSSEPVTPEGKVVGLLLRVVGVALFGYVTASVASYFVGREQEERSARTAADSAAVQSLADEVRMLRERLDRQQSQER